MRGFNASSAGCSAGQHSPVAQASSFPSAVAPSVGPSSAQSPSPSSPHPTPWTPPSEDPTSAQDLQQLASLVDTCAGRWNAEGNTKRLGDVLGRAATLHAAASPARAKAKAYGDLLDRRRETLLNAFQPTLRVLDAPSCLALLTVCVASRMMWRDLAGQLLERLSAECGPEGGGEAALQACPPQALAAVLVACATLGHKQPVLSGLAAEECARRQFAGFDAMALADTAWAMAKLRRKDPAWFGPLVEAAGKADGPMGQGVSAKALFLTWYALARVQHVPASGALLERTAEAAEALRSSASPMQAANLLWALSTLGLNEERIVDALAGRLGDQLAKDPSRMKVADVCQALEALAVMGPEVLSRHSGLVEGLLREAERRWDAGSGSRGARTRALDRGDLEGLWVVQRALTSLGGDLQHVLGAGEGREGSLLEAARVAAKA
ncbi:hypothetical protein HYH03_004171 [Edaphochlamys debaryana]|uniref:Uncharacterized protein n=1 Tax=Edaphochlamys debaryana TaxID=47281 RepID=A0A836C2D8_9CHLO|nr:hypothetical protein HYH03_004171 [Edaphochlamys debaryana]|eukprot:KAG2497906.1 hypothetical protein HYH03_004171 [Edaphochlamys debaryana]